MSVVASNTAWEDIYAQILDGPGEFDDEGDFFPDLDHSSPLDSRTPSPTLLSPPSSDGAEYYALDGALLDADFDFPAIYFPPEPSASSQKRKHPFSTRKDEHKEEHELEPPSKRQKTLALPLSTASSTKSNTKAPSLPKRRGRPPSKSHQRTEGAGNRGKEEDEDIIDIEAKIEEIEERKKTISSLLNTTPSSSPSKHQSAPFSFPFPYSNHGAADSLDLCSSLFADTNNNSSSSSSNNNSSSGGKGINHSFSFPSPTLLGSTAKNISLPNIPLLLPESLFFDASSNSLPPSPDSRVPKPIAKTEEDDDDDETEEDDDDTEGDNDDNDDEGEKMRDLNEDALLSFILDENATAIGAFSFGEMPFRSSNRLQTRFDVHYAISKLLHGQHLEGAIEILAKSFDRQNGNDPSLIMSSNPNNFEFDIFELDETLYIELKEYVEDCLRDQIIPLSPSSSSSSSSSSSPLTISPPYPVVLGLDDGDDGNESESEDLDIDEDSVSIVMVADEVDSNPIISHSSRRYRSRQSQHQQQQHRSHHHYSHHHRHSPFQSASKTTPRSSASYLSSKSPSSTSNNGPKAKSRRRNTQSTIVSSPSSNGTTNQRQKRQTHRSSPPLSPPSSSSSSSSSVGPSPKRKGSSPKSKNTSSNSHTFSNTISSSSLSSFNTSSACSDSSSSVSTGHQTTTTAPSVASAAVSGRHIPDQSVLSHVFQREEVLKIVQNEDEEDEFVDVL